MDCKSINLLLDWTIIKPLFCWITRFSFHLRYYGTSNSAFFWWSSAQCKTDSQNSILVYILISHFHIRRVHIICGAILNVKMAIPSSSLKTLVCQFSRGTSNNFIFFAVVIGTIVDLKWWWLSRKPALLTAKWFPDSALLCQGHWYPQRQSEAEQQTSLLFHK